MTANGQTPTVPDATAGEMHAGTDANAAPTNGATPPSGPQTGADAAQPDSGDYEARLRAGGDFAIQEAKNLASEKDRAKGELSTLKKSLGDLLPLVQGREGAAQQVAAFANAANTLLQNPDYKDAVSAALSGQPVPTRSTQQPDNSEDDFVDPDVKRLQEQLAEERQNRLALEQRFVATSQRQAQGEVEGHIDRAFKGFDFTPEEKDSMLSGAQSELGRMTDAQISAFTDRQWELLLQCQLSTDQLQQAAIRHDARTRQERGNLATDGPLNMNPAQTEQTFEGMSPREVAAAAFARRREQSA